MKKTLHDIFMKPFESFVQTSDEIDSAFKNLDIAFLVWSLDISGGSNVIFQHCDFLQRHGANVTVVSFLKQDVKLWHPVMKKVRIIHIDELPADTVFDIGVVTWWRTFYEIDRVQASTWAYFVQSVESRFYSATTPQYSPVVEATYQLEIPVITISRWLQAYLAFEHNRPSFLVRNGIDKESFTLIGPNIPSKGERKIRFLVEGPLGVDFKQTELALDLLQEFRDYVEIWLLTSSHVASSPLADRVFSQVHITSVGSIMRSCDVLLKLSLVEGMFGPPLEMFHCGGTAIAGKVTGCEEYMVDGYNSRLINDASNVDEIRACIASLINNPDELRTLKEGALTTATMWPNWEKASFEFATALLLIHRNSAATQLARFNAAKRRLQLLDSGAP